jgi:allantoinase
MTAWGGISTLGLGLSLLWTEGQKRGASLKEVVDWMSTKTAKHASLEGRKGQLKVGYDGDFFIWDKDAEFEVSSLSCSPNLQIDNPPHQVADDLLQYKNKISPYKGMKLRGRVIQTYLRGNKVYDNVGGFEVPSGRLLEIC